MPGPLLNRDVSLIYTLRAGPALMRAVSGVPLDALSHRRNGYLYGKFGFAMESVTVRGLRIVFFRAGSGRAMVLLHGYSFNSDVWFQVNLVESLSGSFTLFGVDMPYGTKSRSDKVEAGDRDIYAEVLRDFLSTLEIDRPVLLGASIGGEVVLRYLVRGYSAEKAIVIGPVGLKRLEQQLGKVHVPLLGIWGSKDDVSPPSNAEILRRAPNATIRVIEGAGHAAYLDKPGEFKSVLLEFLS